MLTRHKMMMTAAGLALAVLYMGCGSGAPTARPPDATPARSVALAVAAVDAVQQRCGHDHGAVQHRLVQLLDIEAEICAALPLRAALH